MSKNRRDWKVKELVKESKMCVDEELCRKLSEKFSEKSCSGKRLIKKREREKWQVCVWE